MNAHRYERNESGSSETEKKDEDGSRGGRKRGEIDTFFRSFKKRG